MAIEEILQAFQVIESRKDSHEPASLLICISKAIDLLNQLTEEEEEDHAAVENDRVFQRFQPHFQCLLGLLLCSESPYVAHTARKLLLNTLEFFSTDPALSEAFVELIWRTPDFRRTAATNMFLLLRDMLKMYHGKGNSKAVAVFIDLLGNNISLLSTSSRASELPLGAFWKLLCSSVHILQQQQQQPSAFLRKLCIVLPELVEICMQDQEVVSIRRFLRYKAVMLLYRLSAFDDSDAGRFCLLFVSKVLQTPSPSTAAVTQYSPFVSGDGSTSLELQRRAVLVLLKTTVTANKSNFEDVSHLAGCVLSDWLAYSLQTKITSMEVLAAYLIHLCTDEDDLLIDLLITLMDFEPSWYKNDLYQRLITAVTPLRLFHLFLAALHYDHSVLLDFLISQNTGITFLQYLLRCLRLVKDTWPDFLSAASFETKKRNRIEDCSSSETVSVKQAINCLTKLEEAIEKLHDKNLFPYNASVLLQRFRLVFQEL